MNKFLNRSVKPQKSAGGNKTSISRDKNTDLLMECESCWRSLDSARRKLTRGIMYAYGDQWGDLIKDPVTNNMITESQLIKNQGKVPLKNNMIAPILKNIDGQFRSNTMDVICSVRDQSEAKVGEMMSIAMEYVHDINEISEVDADLLRLLMLGGFIGQRIEFGWNPAKRLTDVWVYNINPSRLFFNSNIEDARSWDVTMIGEIYDMRLRDVVSKFAKNEADRKMIEEIYGTQTIEDNSFLYNGMQGDERRNMDFYIPSRSGLCRVILVWKQESRQAWFCHDYLKGEWYYEDLKNKYLIDEENRRRTADAKAHGVEDEDILLIEYEYSNELYWQYTYLTPFGEVLQTGRSPYWHEGPNICVLTSTMVEGELHSPIEDFIDQQRAINRTMTLIDFLRSSGPKGMLVVDEDSLESMTREEIVDEWVRYNGVIFVKLKDGKRAQDVITQFNSNAVSQADFQILNLQLKLINEISGVNNAMQGRGAPAGTPASMYMQQVQNSSINLRPLFETFKAFRRRRDYKVMQTIQQYYNTRRYIDIGGSSYSNESKFYDPEKVQNASIDLKLTDGTNSPVYQMYENETLMELFKAQAIDVKTYLENSTLPFKDSILESIKQSEQQAQENGKMQGIDPRQMNAVAEQSGNPQMVQQMNDDSNYQEGDGVIHKA